MVNDYEGERAKMPVTVQVFKLGQSGPVPSPVAAYLKVESKEKSSWLNSSGGHRQEILVKLRNTSHPNRNTYTVRDQAVFVVVMGTEKTASASGAGRKLPIVNPNKFLGQLQILAAQASMRSSRLD